MERSNTINEAERIVNHLRMFEHAVDVIKQAHADETEEGARKKRLEKLQQQIAEREEQVAELEERKATLAKSIEEGTRHLEEEQHRRAVAAQQKADREIKAANDEKARILAANKKEIDQSNSDKAAAKRELDEMTRLLKEKREEHDQFIRRVARR